MGKNLTMADFDFTMLLAVILLLVVFFVFHYRRPKRRYNLPPGPKKVFFHGNSETTNGDITDAVIPSLNKKYGPIVCVHVGNTPIIYLHTYNLVHEAFVKNGDKISHRPNHLYTIQATQLHKGIIWRNGEDWKKYRRMAIRFLRDQGAGNKMEDRLVTEFQVVSSIFQGHAGKPFSPFEPLRMAVCSLIVSTVFGMRFDYDSKEFQLALAFANFVAEGKSLYASSKENQIPFYQLKYRLSKFLHGKTQRDLKKQSIGLPFYKMVCKMAEEHRNTFDPNNIRDFIDAHLDTERKTNEVLPMADLTLQILDLIVAGTDTTSSSLSWMLIYMISYPDIQEKCFAEIRHEVGTSRMVSIADKDKLPYTNAVIAEVLRLSSIARRSITHMAYSDAVVHGYDIPKGALVIADLASCLRDGAHFAEPEKFRPERFLDDNGRFKKPQSYIPFSTGPRICLGEFLAKKTLFMFFSNLVQRFQFRKVPGEQLDFTPSAGLTNTTKPYRVISIERV